MIDVNYRILNDVRFGGEPDFYVFSIRCGHPEVKQTRLLPFSEADVAFDSWVNGYRKRDASYRDGLSVTLARADGVVIKHAYDLAPLGEVHDGVYV